MSANLFDCNNNPLIQKASKNGWPTIRKTFYLDDLLAEPDPSDRNLRRIVEELARRTYGFVGTESDVYPTGNCARVVVVINNPDSIGVI